MITLKISYLGKDGTVSESIMQGFSPWSDSHCYALPKGSDYMEKVLYDNIIDAVDVDTGEIISVRELCGARPLARPITTPLLRKERPKKAGNRSEIKINKEIRRTDNLYFKSRYRNEVILNHFRNKLIDLFGGRCFACDNPSDLIMDHHVPLSKGGRKEPGNIVMLCFRCNAQKWNFLPEEYYSSDELLLLKSLLEKEYDVLKFDFDNAKWLGDRYAYLLEIGISPLLLDEIKTNYNHIWHMEIAPEPIEIFYRA